MRFKQLPPGELDEFSDRFARWQQEEAGDELLVRVIQRGLSPTDDARLKTLIAKSERGIGIRGKVEVVEIQDVIDGPLHRNSRVLSLAIDLIMLSFTRPHRAVND